MSQLEVEASYETIAAEVFPSVLELGHVAMQFAQVNRATGDINAHPESDTDHTVMLSLIAVSLAEHDPRLDKGKVALYALVHDLVEVYAGDVPTLHQDKVDFVAKAKAEAEALDRLEEQFGKTFPGLIQALKDYEALEDLESQFVKTLDKSMPAITHLFNDGSKIDGQFDSAEQVRENSIRHTEKLVATYGADHPLVIALRKLISEKFVDEFAARRAYQPVLPFVQ